MSTFIGIGANTPKKDTKIEELKSRIAELEEEVKTAISDKESAEKKVAELEEELNKSTKKSDKSKNTEESVK